MKTKSITQNNFFRFALGTAAILMIPLLFRWPWSLGDFVVMGTLIFGTGLMHELGTKILGKKNRVIIGVVLVIALLWLWVELAVGLFTNWGS